MSAKHPAQRPNLHVVRRLAEDGAAVAHELVNRDRDALRLVVALNDAPVREYPKRIKAVADYQQATAVLHLDAYRLARAAAANINTIIDMEDAA
jgi:hypothetical protein